MQQYSQISFPKLTPINKTILISVLAIFLLDSALMKMSGVSLSPYLQLTPAKFFDGHLYQILTYPLLCNSILELLFNGLLLWFVGSELESLWGNRKYLFFIFFSQIVAAVLFLGLSTFFWGEPWFFSSMGSLHGLSQAMIVAYGVLFPERQFSFMFIFPVKAKYFCIIIVAIEFYMAVLGQGGLPALGHLFQMGMGFVSMLLMVKPVVKGFLEKDFSASRPKSRLSNKNSHLKLVKKDHSEQDSDKPPKYWQ